MEQTKKCALAAKAAQIRLDILEEVHAAKSGHPGGSLSIADVMTYLYFEEMNINPADPKWADRDRLVLSKGHTAPALYAILAEQGFFPREELKKLRQIDSFLQGHPDMKHTPGVDMTTGSLGLGISAACGMALAAKIDNKDQVAVVDRVFVAVNVFVCLAISSGGKLGLGRTRDGNAGTGLLNDPRDLLAICLGAGRCISRITEAYPLERRKVVSAGGVAAFADNAE